jgi:hypothetical protein
VLSFPTKFGIEDYGFEEGLEFKLSEVMKDKRGVWEESVRENGLQLTKLEEVGDWWFAYFVLRVEGVLDSMNKAKELGFFINWMIIHFATL